MKKYILLLLISVPFLQSKAQSYKKLADSALRLMWNAKDESGYRKSFDLYEKAFVAYPKDINSLGYYKAAVLAGELNEFDKAFVYLDKLLALNTDRNTTWGSIAGPYAKSEYKNLVKDKRWPIVEAQAQKMKADFFEKLASDQKEFEQTEIKNIDFNTLKTGKEAYEAIKTFSKFKPKSKSNYSIKFKVTDSLSTSYFISLPQNYDPKKSYPLMFFLHGAVQSNGFSLYQNESVLEGWNRFYTKYAKLNNVIMVYPQGSKKYNWMGPDDGFFMIPAMLKEIKQAINIDDDKVFITGHSNGATGSFSYLMKQQSPFAGFYGFNTQPKVRTGGTFIKNIANRSYFNVSTDEDYYFPPDANDSLNVIMKNLKADYQDHRYNGWPHWFPQFDESEPVYPLIFADIKARKRNPFQDKIYWESDDLKYGKADWLQINEFDTLAKPASWHKNINFNIYKLLSYDKNEDLISKDTLVKTFNFPRKSAVLKASYKNNRFDVETSNVKSLSIFISPEMVDISKPIEIYVNGVKKVTKKVIYNKEFIIQNFNETLDRKAVWADKIKIEL
ncbi:MAG: hypothetical protein EOO96_04105 [Pedobacter sp.]|nr:MAG: hypothetical protein EOO96_04105 [Pedobacter sp.]